MLLVCAPDGTRYKLLECNPLKVVRDIDGNTASDKVMVQRIGQEGWIGQVRRLCQNKEAYYFKQFV